MGILFLSVTFVILGLIGIAQTGAHPLVLAPPLASGFIAILNLRKTS